MCEYNVYAQCVLVGMPRSRSIPLEGRLMDCCMDCRHGLPLQGPILEAEGTAEEQSRNQVGNRCGMESPIALKPQL